MRVVRFFIPSRLLVSSLTCAVGATTGGIACQQEQTQSRPQPSAANPPALEVTEGEQPIGGVASVPAQPVMVKQGSLPLVYLSEHAQTVQVHDLTDNDILAEMPVAGRSIVRIDQRNGVVVGKELLFPGPLDAKHTYGVFVIPDDQNTTDTETRELRAPREAAPGELDQ